MARRRKVKLNDPALLTWARQSAGYSVDDVAGWFDTKSAQDIRAWEDGADAPTYRQLEKFARKVRRPVAVLFLPEPPGEPPRPQDFRMLPGVPQGQFTPKALRAFRELRANIAELVGILEDLQVPLSLSLPHWPDIDDPVVPRAMRLRDQLGISVETQLQCGDPRQAMHEWRDVLFDAGVLVQMFPVPVEELRGFSVLDDRIGGVGISSKDAPVARIFSLFHEVGHLCLRKPGVSGTLHRDVPDRLTAAVEGYCNAFAAAFLLPPEHSAVMQAMHELERDFTLPHVRRWAAKFQVSKYVVARSMLDTGRVTPDRYWTETDAWRGEDARLAGVAKSKEKGRDGGPSRTTVRVTHAGKRYVATVIDAFHRGVLTRHEAARILALRPDRLSEAQAMALSA